MNKPQGLICTITALTLVGCSEKQTTYQTIEGTVVSQNVNFKHEERARYNILINANGKFKTFTRNQAIYSEDVRLIELADLYTKPLVGTTNKITFTCVSPSEEIIKIETPYGTVKFGEQ